MTKCGALLFVLLKACWRPCEMGKMGVSWESFHTLPLLCFQFQLHHTCPLFIGQKPQNAPPLSENRMLWEVTSFVQHLTRLHKRASRQMQLPKALLSFNRGGRTAPVQKQKICSQGRQVHVNARSCPCSTEYKNWTRETWIQISAHLVLACSSLNVIRLNGVQLWCTHPLHPFP